jgi:hypothetical protein
VSIGPIAVGCAVAVQVAIRFVFDGNHILNIVSRCIIGRMWAHFSEKRIDLEQVKLVGAFQSANFSLVVTQVIASKPTRPVAVRLQQRSCDSTVSVSLSEKLIHHLSY